MPELKDVATPEMTFHLAIRSEIEILAPAALVWDYLHRPTEWKSSIVSIERIAGSPGEEGETLRIGQRPAEETVYVIMRTLRSTPSEWRVQTISTEANQMTDGYVSYALSKSSTGTYLVANFIARCMLDSTVTLRQPLAEYVALIGKATNDKLDADHAALKTLIEQTTKQNT